MEKNKKQIKDLVGTIVSDKMKKTAVVAVSRLKWHPKYKKQYKVTTRYKAHDQNSEYKVGDKVVIAETRPMSKNKRWRVVKRLAGNKSLPEGEE